MLRRVSQFKMYKELFNNIEEEWEQSYFMEDDFAGRKTHKPQLQKSMKSTSGMKQ